MNITLTAADNQFYLFDGFLGGASDAALVDVRDASVDGGAGRDQLNIDYAYPDRNFNFAVDASTGVVTLTTATGSIRLERFEVVAFNNVDFLIGSIGGDALTGATNNDPGLYGLGGDDTLDGGAGRDVLFGGAGNDTYVVDDSGDSVQEATTLNGGVDAGGVDIVRAAINFALGNFLENLELIGSAVTGTGNALANAITGNSVANSLTGAAGDDTLDGGLGADTLSGGAGNDVYVLDNPLDVVLEDGVSDPGGLDTVRSTVTHTLGERFENLVLLGSAPASATGNALSNRLTGNDADNTLEGGAGNDALEGRGGADSLRGGAGNDTYIVNGTGDRVDEATAPGSGVDAGGKDVVRSSVSFTLGDFVETLILTGAGSLKATGNGLGNTITGNSGANVLTGLGGADVLNGGAGNDTLNGGVGRDSFVFSSPLNAQTNVDLIIGFSTSTSPDRIRLDNDIFTALGAPGALAATAFTNGEMASTPDHRIVYDRPSGHLFYDPDGSGPEAQVHFATLGLSAHPALSAGAFLITD